MSESAPIPAIRQELTRLAQIFGLGDDAVEWMSVKFRGMDPFKIEAKPAEQALPARLTRYEVAILQAIRDSDDPLQLKEICRRTRIPRTTVVRSLGFLKRRNLITNDAGGYSEVT